MQCTEKMLNEAVKKAVEVGLLPKASFPEDSAKNWEKIKAVIEAALSAA